MADKSKKSPKKPDATADLEQRVDELTADLQRTRADFENYQKRMTAEKQTARTDGQAAAVLKLLPVVDTIDRAIAHMPTELADNAWAEGVAKLPKRLEAALSALNVERIKAASGEPFDPRLHEAIQFDEDAAGEHEVIAEELQAGYLMNGTPIRHAMVKVTKQ